MPNTGANNGSGKPGVVREREQSARAEETERKRARGALSCAECRRLKLKCDKADTDRLHRKISEMSERIRQLEDALSLSHATSYSVASSSSVPPPREPHPLLTEDLLKVKSTIDLHSASSGTIPGSADSQHMYHPHFQHLQGQSLSPYSRPHSGDGGAPQDSKGAGAMKTEENTGGAYGTIAAQAYGMYDTKSIYGRSAGSDALLSSPPPKPSKLLANPLPALPHSILHLSVPFFSAPSHSPPTSIDTLHETIRSHLPPYPTARALCASYLRAAWCAAPVTRSELEREILPLFYPEARTEGTIWTTTPASNGIPTRFGPHRTALLFAILALGVFSDFSRPPPPSSASSPRSPPPPPQDERQKDEESTRYIHLSRAALNLQPVFDRPPCVSTVQTLSFMATHKSLQVEEDSVEGAWAFRGMSAKLAQSLELHRDCSRFRLSAHEAQKRRSLFWHICFTDCMMSLATGRLPTFDLAFIDCALPDETVDGAYGADTLAAIASELYAWKARFARDCLVPVCHGILTAKAPAYATILALDRTVRDAEMPLYSRVTPSPSAADFGTLMHHFIPRSYRDQTLLYIHRCYFAQAVCDQPADPLKSPYAPSFLAAYRSACNILNTLKEIAEVYPAELARCGELWSHAFSSAVMLASVVTHAPRSKVSNVALMELKQACDLFEKVAAHKGRPAKFLPILQRLMRKADRKLAGLALDRSSALDALDERLDAAADDHLVGYARLRSLARSSLLDFPTTTGTGYRQHAESAQRTPIGGSPYPTSGDAESWEGAGVGAPIEEEEEEEEGEGARGARGLDLPPTDLAYTYVGNLGPGAVVGAMDGAGMRHPWAGMGMGTDEDNVGGRATV
ncbi:hypothetical protein PUNSTDRAFT_125868 [Punctularia strigosozonata HHB-11173 SS5]|uniref:uncharacterized protein n=1 Tax=Punctularia strigosozonata (strain HHB-11173) TaxID=741275 RepID=UPI00044166A4|nr:uncharacterized protein PUNSTDRAFT_125868 [Punctularia strigosozonata HHB-11173 SS5]EIN09837.1 hypothetical protein PUNSTDRAFT_125868 [Punctularia strigosozonata HHB-11173 SS5]